jgi:hypothetical protein
VAGIDTAREKFQLQRYLDSMEKLDSEESPEFDNAGVQAALKKLKHHPEPEVGFMVMGATRSLHITCRAELIPSMR